MGVLAENRRARFDYEILETFEAGLELTGQEVKSIQGGRANLAGSFVTVHDNALWLTNVGIPPWQVKNAPPDYNEQRPRRLLLHRSEIATLIGKIQRQGLTVVPLKLYTRGRRIKVEIGVVRYRKKADQREMIKKREAEREIRRNLRSSPSTSSGR